MRHLTWGAIALVLAGAAAAQTESPAPPLSGQIRLQWDQRQASSGGPLAAADRLLPGTVAAPGDGATLAVELHGSGKGWNASATLQQQTQRGVTTRNRAWFHTRGWEQKGGWGASGIGARPEHRCLEQPKPRQIA